MTVVFSKPITQLIESFSEGRKASLLILRTIIGIGNADTGIDSGFVDIKPTAIKFQDFKRQVTPPDFIVIRRTVTGHPARSSRLRKR